jgi:transposase
MIYHNNDIFNEQIIKHNNDLPMFFNKNSTNINTNSWFNINQNNAITNHNNIKIKYKFKKEELIKCMKVKMIPTMEQKQIIHKWFDSCTKIYNETLNFINNKYKFTKYDINRTKIIDELNKSKNANVNNFYNFYSTRKELREIKNNIQRESQLENIDKNTKIHIHTLDYSIKQLCSNIESAKSNLLNGNIKRFRLKYWRNNRCSKTIEIEKEYIRNNKICPHIFGDIKYIYNKEEVDLINIDSNVKINYNSITDEYLLLIPIKTKNKEINNKTKNIISLDPGLRTFMVGVSEKESLNIADGINDIIVKDIKRLETIIDNKDIPKRIKKKNEILINRKISNKIDDLHWKSIKYLTHNYKIIFLGDMSAKDIVNRNNSVLKKYQKIACLRTKYFLFKTRLEFKCKLNNIYFKYIDESYTSKTCSICSNYYKELEGSKIYYCQKCNNTIDRDINGARNIYIKSYL